MTTETTTVTVEQDTIYDLLSHAREAAGEISRHVLELEHALIASLGHGAIPERVSFELQDLRRVVTCRGLEDRIEDLARLGRC